MSTPAQPSHAHGVQSGKAAGLAGLVVGAIGVVFGDIGTSPLYTLKEAFSPHYGLTPRPRHRAGRAVAGVLGADASWSR